MISEFFDIIRDFFERGGTVLWFIFFTLIFLWSLIIERFIYYKKDFPGDLQKMVTQWKSRSDHHSWYACQIRQSEVATLSQKLFQNISLIKTLVALCPLMGLLGTVTGMVHVFDVMAETGTGNARMMASGISLATIPTMSGMVAALSGLYFGNLLENKAKKEVQKARQSLVVTLEG